MAGALWKGSMVTTEHTETTEDFEARLMKQAEDAEAGAYDDVLAEQLLYLLSQLPDGYILDETSRIVRLDPNLPDHVHVTSMINGVPSGRVRIRAYWVDEPRRSRANGPWS